MASNTKPDAQSSSLIALKDIILLPLMSGCAIALAIHEVKTVAVFLALILLRLIYNFFTGNSQRHERTQEPIVLKHAGARITMQMVLLAILTCVFIYSATFHWHINTRQGDALMLGVICALMPLELPVELEVLFRQTAAKLSHSRMKIRELSTIPTLGATTIIFANIANEDNSDNSSLPYKQLSNAVDAARHARIKICLLTDASTETAKSIAKRIHLVKHLKELVVANNRDVQKLSDTQLLELIEVGNTIFCRLSDENRTRLVSLAKQKSHVVAFLGSSDADMQASIEADIIVANKKDELYLQADIVGEHTDLVTLVHAVQQGRAALKGAWKVTLVSLATHSSEFGILFVSLFALGLFHIPAALTGLEVLAINLPIVLFPILAIGKDMPAGELMAKPFPKRTAQGLTAHELKDLLWCGALVSSFAFLNYLWFFKRNNITGTYLASSSPIQMQATTLTLLTVILCQVVNILQQRTKDRTIKRHQLHNRAFWLGMLATLFSASVIIYVPWLSSFFGTRPLTAADWSYAAGAAILFGLVREFQRYTAKHRRQAVLELHHTLRNKVTV